MTRCQGLSGPGVGVWIGPCWCNVLHHFLGFGADFLGVFWMAEGCFLAGQNGMYVIVVKQAFRDIALKAQKTADITTCQQFQGFGVVVLLRWCVILLGFGGSFQQSGTFFWGINLDFGGVVYDANGAWSALFPLARMTSGVGPSSSGIFGSHMWRPQKGACWSFSTSRRF